MKHLLSISTLYPNDAKPRFGTFVARSLEALAKRGDWRVTVVNPIGIPPVAIGRYRALADLAPVSEERGVTVHRPRFTLIPKVGTRRNVGAIARSVLPLVRKLHDDEPIDLIDAQFFYPDGPAVAEIARATGLPFSIKARGSDIAYWGDQDFARDAMLEAARSADGVLAVSEALKSDMAARGFPPEKIRVHYTGLDRDRFRPLDHTRLRAQVGSALGLILADNAPLLACVGNLSPRKGQDRAIEALPAIDGAVLILVGQGDDEDRLRSLAAERGVAGRVHFTGAIDHFLLPLILSAADAMVLPTQSEGLANAWVEALACGTPVITTDVGGAREIIVDDVAGRLLDDREPATIAAAVNALLNNPPSSEEVAAHADRFSWDSHAADLAEYYSTLLDRN